MRVRDFDDSGSKFTVVAADLRKPNHQVRDTVFIHIKNHSKQAGQVEKVLVEDHKFEYVVDFGKVRVAEKIIVG